MPRSNCILFARKAMRRLLAWAAAPGREHWRIYYEKRPSDWGPFNHRLVGFENHRTGSKHKLSLKPVDPRKRLLPPPLFVGRVTWGDTPKGPPC